jgi:signal transduction histidine kinase
MWGVGARTLYVRKSREAALLRERARISRDLHDHLGARLTHLAMVSEMVGQQVDQPASMQALATRLSESARELTRTMGEVIWATDPEKDTLQSFALFVTRYAERFFEETTVRLRFDIPTKLPDIVLPSEARNSLFMVAKEAITNVAKYAGASELRLELDCVDRELRLLIADNGRGFSTSEVRAKSSGNGLVNMEKRLKDLGGQLWVESVVGQGTRIYARLQVSTK